MTNREAIELLEDDNTSIKSTISDGIQDSMTLRRYSDFAEALDLAIQALEKQWPKKPKMTVFKTEVCPDCKNDIIRYHGPGWGFRYCPNCGQALDWSIDDEK